MHHRMVLCGGNGAGKSTLGRELARKMSLRLMDIEEYYFPKTSADYPYRQARTQEEAAALLLADMKQAEGFVLAAVKADYSPEISRMFTAAVYIDVPKEIRMQRIRERSFGKFGHRMQPGGDLYEQEQRFFDMVQNRTDEPILTWLAAMNIPLIRIDGQQPVEANAAYVMRWLHEKEQE